MTVARAQLVDLTLTRWFHCISRCVRRAFLCGAGYEHRKQWIENRLQELADIFAIAVGGFAIMDNHLHVLLRVDPEIAEGWSEEEVVRRWAKLFPPKDKKGNALPVSEAWVQERLADKDWVAKTRQRLQDLSWFMKCLKEPLSRMANKEDGCRGAFWEGRFKSVAILDHEALLTVCAYIDLNPVAAGIFDTPEESDHTSCKGRVEHVKSQGREDDLKASEQGTVAGSAASAHLEDDYWLCPIEDRRRLEGTREGMLEGFPLGSYLLLLDATGRMFREGKERIAEEAEGILDRLGMKAEAWQSRLSKLFSGRLFGRFFASSRERLREGASHLGLHHLANFGGCQS